MTLIIMLANQSSIHESSDYRLTSVGSKGISKFVDVAGAKQIPLMIPGGPSVRISFTGLAEIGKFKTRECIAKVIQEAEKPMVIEKIAARIATETSNAINHLSASKTKFLTIIFSIVKTNEKPRLMLISNCNGFDAPIQKMPLAQLEIYPLKIRKPTILTFGWNLGVSDTDKKLLKHLIRTGAGSKEIQETLCEVNQRAAKNPKSNGFVSEGCMVSSLNNDGTGTSKNCGQVPGVPDEFMGNFNMGEYVRTHFQAAPGKKITLLQSASGKSEPR